ncbi:MAG: hypothetical protein ACYC6C_09440 [Coriobacteriia bacterium]
MPQRRRGKSFEPPPWEREQFEQLARAREAQRDESELDQALRELDEAREVVPDAAAVPLKPMEASFEAEAKPAAHLDDARVIEMLAQLSAEEPRPIDELWRVGLIGAVVTAAIGLMMIVFGVIGLAKTIKAGPMGIFSASILLLFGSGFCALAAWTAVRTLKQRGVL